MKNITNFFSKEVAHRVSVVEEYFGKRYISRMKLYSNKPFFVEQIKLTGIVYHRLMIIGKDDDNYFFHFFYEDVPGHQKYFSSRKIRGYDMSDPSSDYSQIEDLRINEGIYSLTIEYSGHVSKRWIGEGYVEFPEYVALNDIQLYGKEAAIETVCRMKIGDSVYSILSTQEDSPLRIRTNKGIKNIKLIPVDEFKNSKLRIKTNKGIMAIAIREL